MLWKKEFQDFYNKPLRLNKVEQKLFTRRYVFHNKVFFQFTSH